MKDEDDEALEEEYGSPQADESLERWQEPKEVTNELARRYTPVVPVQKLVNTDAQPSEVQGTLER